MHEGDGCLPTLPVCRCGHSPLCSAKKPAAHAESLLGGRAAVARRYGGCRTIRGYRGCPVFSLPASYLFSRSVRQLFCVLPFALSGVYCWMFRSAGPKWFLVWLSASSFGCSITGVSICQRFGKNGLISRSRSGRGRRSAAMLPTGVSSAAGATMLAVSLHLVTPRLFRFM